MNEIIIEFRITELNRNIGILTRQGNMEKAEELKKELESYQQDLSDVRWQNLEERVGLRSLERNA
jgi:hypothetical protein